MEGVEVSLLPGRLPVASRARVAARRPASTRRSTASRRPGRTSCTSVASRTSWTSMPGSRNAASSWEIPTPPSHWRAARSSRAGVVERRGQGRAAARTRARLRARSGAATAGARKALEASLAGGQDATRSLRGRAHAARADRARPPGGRRARTRDGAREQRSLLAEPEGPDGPPCRSVPDRRVMDPTKSGPAGPLFAADRSNPTPVADDVAVADVEDGRRVDDARQRCGRHRNRR